MRHYHLIWATMLLGLPLAGQVASHAPTSAQNQQPVVHAPAGQPVVRVNGAVLTDRDLQREIFTIFPYARQHGGNVPKELEPGIRKGALEMIIFEELVYQEAARRKMTISSERMNRAESEFRRQFPTPDDYSVYVQTECQGSQQVMREKIRRSLLIEELLKQEVDSKSAVSVAEARTFYDKNPANFTYGESFAIQTISFLPPANANPSQLQEARKRAEDALRQAQATKSYEEFGVLAEKISEDDYRVMMGDHKTVDRSQLAPPVIRAVASLQPGQITGLIQVETAYTIVRLNKHVPAGKVKFEDVKEQLRKQMEKTKTNQVRADLDKRLRQKARVEVL